MNLLSFAFVDPSMFFATMTLKYGRHFKGGMQTPFADCHHIMLRELAGDGEIVETTVLKEWPSARQLIENVRNVIPSDLAGPNLQLGQIMVQSLLPGGHIPWHIDDSPYAQAHSRFRLLVSPCFGGTWYSNGDMLNPGVGNLTFINHRALHSMINLGTVPQISLVVDVRKPTLQ